MLEEIVGGIAGIIYALAKVAVGMLLSLPWWLATVIVLAGGFLIFLAYQQSEHSMTSFVTKALVYAIAFGVIVFGVLAYMNASGGIPGI